MKEDNVLDLKRFGARCMHNKFKVTPSLGYVECGICGEHLSPMWVLEELCGLETRLVNRLTRLEELIEKAEAKNRCKCEKCGKMTRIQK